MQESLESPPVRRRHTSPGSSARAHDQRERNRSGRDGSVEQRLERVESVLREIQQAIDSNAKRLTALQAQLDHLSVRFRTV